MTRPPEKLYEYEVSRVEPVVSLHTSININFYFYFIIYSYTLYTVIDSIF